MAIGGTIRTQSTAAVCCAGYVVPTQYHIQNCPAPIFTDCPVVQKKDVSFTSQFFSFVARGHWVMYVRRFKTSRCYLNGSKCPRKITLGQRSDIRFFNTYKHVKRFHTTKKTCDISIRLTNTDIEYFPLTCCMYLSL
jgi:hypothetical protein